MSPGSMTPARQHSDPRLDSVMAHLVRHGDDKGKAAVERCILHSADREGIEIGKRDGGEAGRLARDQQSTPSFSTIFSGRVMIMSKDTSG